MTCEAWIKQGDPKEVILNEVKRVRPDLLVVGSRGLGPFQKYVHDLFIHCELSDLKNKKKSRMHHSS